MKDVYAGDKRMELNVVPAFSVRVTPALAVIPMAAASARPAQREIHVTVTNGTKGAAQASVALELPAGWKAAPASAPLAFAHEDESLSARFQVTASRGREDRRVHTARGGHLDRHRRARSSPRGIRRSNIRTSSAAR